MLVFLFLIVYILDDEQFTDTTLFHFFYRKGQALIGHSWALSHLGDSAQQFHHQAGNGIIVPLRQVHLHQVGNLVNRCAAIYRKGIFTYSVDFLLLIVIFVLNVSDDFLNDILEGDDA